MATRRARGRTTASEDEVRKYLRLVEYLAEHTGRPKRGWQARVARRLGVHPTYVSKLLSGERASVGADAIESAIESVPIAREYFTGGPALDRTPEAYIATQRRLPQRKQAAIARNASELRLLDYYESVVNHGVAFAKTPTREQRVRLYRELAQMVLESPVAALARAVLDAPDATVEALGEELRDIVEPQALQEALEIIREQTRRMRELGIDPDDLGLD